MMASTDGPIEIYYDNNGVITQAKESRSHKKSKHILQRYHLIREIVQQRDVMIYKVDTEMNTNNSLTKSLSLAKHMMHSTSIDIIRMGD
jgi:hypothetical protein